MLKFSSEPCGPGDFIFGSFEITNWSSLVVKGCWNFFHIVWVVIVCVFWRNYLFCQSCQIDVWRHIPSILFIIILMCAGSSVIACFIPGTGMSHIYPLSVLLEVYQFYWCFQSMAFVSLVFFALFFCLLFFFPFLLSAYFALF